MKLKEGDKVRFKENTEGYFRPEAVNGTILTIKELCFEEGVSKAVLKGSNIPDYNLVWCSSLEKVN